MDGRDLLLQLARYHAWASARLVDRLAPLSDADWRRDCGLVFRSIHGTLNHLLLADRLWYGRFTGQPILVTGLDEELVAERAELQRQLLYAAGRWTGLIAGAAAARFEGGLVFVTTEGTARSMPYALTLAHVFNHGTHHRGQVSAAMTALGQPAPELDLYFCIRERQQEQGGDAVEAVDALLQARFAELNGEIAHYPSPIARCDVQLGKLIEQRAEVLDHQRQWRRLAAAGATGGEMARIGGEMLAAEVYDGAEAAAVRRRLQASAGP